MKSLLHCACVALCAGCLPIAIAQTASEPPVSGEAQKDPFHFVPTPERTPSPANNDPSIVNAPTLTVGDRWTWNVVVNPQDNCTSGIPNGAQETETVTSVSHDGHRSEIVGPEANSRYSRTFSNDGSYRAVLDGKEVRSTPVSFPLRPGKKWDTTFVGGIAIQSLECEAAASERMKVDGEDLEVFPITCDGRWRNRQFGNSDKSTWKYWYSPTVGASVRRTILTWYQGKHCADLDYRLVKYLRVKPVVNAGSETGVGAGKLEKDLFGTWIVDIESEHRSRTLTVKGVRTDAILTRRAD